ncbi:uncharacterized protein BKA55DRAFT_707446 [Fusarium redolens]|uniref:PA14 domain-containing protein n=1 Tax=Fusarium redolens TaxID=48865 RepID=A0A9P9GGU0_FUSRE|nr:uncharacterized protein BKA55DRAFT_707446 [Fusarium redolens]KAH7237729.1 hypothetical protein BKA55DRAFT_707446 [Fusarium redolens]
MLFRKLFLAAAAVATVYAGPCKPVSSRASVSSSADISIPSSTRSVEVLNTVTSGSSDTEGATSSVTIGSETVTSGGFTTFATQLSNTGSTSEDVSTSAAGVSGSQSSDLLVSSSGIETFGSSADTAVTDTATSEAIATGTTDMDPTTEPTASLTADATTDTVTTAADKPTTKPTTKPTGRTTTNATTTNAPMTLPTTDDTTGLVTEPIANGTTEPTSDATTDPSTTQYSTTQVPTLDSGSANREKRGQDEIEIPEAIPSDWTGAQTSGICSCLDLETPTTHTTITQTVEPTTFITASTDVVTPIEEYTKIITTTSVSVFTSTVTEKKTSTVTAWVVETTFADNNDIAYRRYTSNYNANVYDDGFTTNYFKTKNPLSSGYMQSLQFSTCNTLTIPGSGTFDASQAALVFNAYFYAKETGMYTFSVPDTIDNWGYLWVRDAAYSWNVDAWAIQGTRTGQNSQLWKGGSYQIRLNKGDAIPFTYLWANGGGCAGNDLSVRTPSGKSIPGMAGSTVKACHVSKFT